MMDKQHLLSEAETLTEYWSPKVVGKVNDHLIKVAKIKDEFVWHDHAGEDEMFFILKGSLVMQLRDSEDVKLSEGDMYVVPKGVVHSPLAAEECLIAVIEPAETKHTGDVDSPLTKTLDDQLQGFEA